MIDHEYECKLFIFLFYLNKQKLFTEAEAVHCKCNLTS